VISYDSFFAFRTNEPLETLVVRVKRAIAEGVDLVVIGSNENRAGRTVGNLQDRDILALVPGMKEV